MAAAARMFRRVPIRRRIATERRAAGLADAQVDPPRANLHAFLALVRMRRLDLGEAIDVGTLIRGHPLILEGFHAPRKWPRNSNFAARSMNDSPGARLVAQRLSKGPAILHVATHGFFLGPCEPSAAATRGIGGVTGARARPKPSSTPHELARSGLALAGANGRAAAPAGSDDGILTAEEVSSLDLRGVEWVVLSACDTGVGDVRTGEGVFGLRRAFAAAAAHTTIMSLWSVEDQSTREWMGHLYRARLERNITTVEAVTAAGRAILRDRRARRLSTHPFYWAAFVAAGNWR
jgi:hypothetical protein